MKHTKIKESDFFIAWIVFFLSATIGGAIIGAVFGAIIGAILGASGTPMPQIVLITGLVGFIIGIPVSYCCFRFSVSALILRKVIDTPFQTLPPDLPEA